MKSYLYDVCGQLNVSFLIFFFWRSRAWSVFYWTNARDPCIFFSHLISGFFFLCNKCSSSLWWKELSYVVHASLSPRFHMTRVSWRVIELGICQECIEKGRELRSWKWLLHTVCGAQGTTCATGTRFSLLSKNKSRNHAKSSNSTCMISARDHTSITCIFSLSSTPQDGRN
jgi:hypothetical protein